MPRPVLGISGKEVIRCCPEPLMVMEGITVLLEIVVVAGNAPPIDITVYSNPHTTFVVSGVPVAVVQCTCGLSGVPILQLCGNGTVKWTSCIALAENVQSKTVFLKAVCVGAFVPLLVASGKTMMSSHVVAAPSDTMVPSASNLVCPVAPPKALLLNDFHSVPSLKMVSVCPAVIKVKLVTPLMVPAMVTFAVLAAFLLIV